MILIIFLPLYLCSWLVIRKNVFLNSDYYKNFYHQIKFYLFKPYYVFNFFFKTIIRLNRSFILIFDKLNFLIKNQLLNQGSIFKKISFMIESLIYKDSFLSFHFINHKIKKNFIIELFQIYVKTIRSLFKKSFFIILNVILYFHHKYKLITDF